MPSNLHSFDIDWTWSALTAPEQAIVRRCEAKLRADPAAQTQASLEQALLQTSTQLGGRKVSVRLDDADGERFVTIVAGRCEPSRSDDFDPDGELPDPLGAADYRAAGIQMLSVGLFWREDTLEQLREQATRLNRSLSWLVQQAWFIAQNNPIDELRGVDPVALTKHLPNLGRPRRQSVYLSLDTYQQLEGLATQEDISMSTLVYRAVASAWPTLSALNPAPQTGGGIAPKS
jgi:uncharacterized small protein (TIGR04563 family)